MRPAESRAGARPVEIVLASSSPRRRELLARAGVPFRAVSPDIDERPRRAEPPAAFAQRVAREKAAAVARRLGASRGPRRTIGCDTIVVLAGQILGKPRSAADARRMLRRLSGRTHQVISGVAVLSEAPGRRPRTRSRAVATEVRFRRLSEKEIRAYVASGDPMDKAGAYGIQEGAAHFVRWIRGSYSNVVGLPLVELLDLLHRAGGPPAAGSRRIGLGCTMPRG